MKKIIFSAIFSALTMLSYATERTVDTTFISAPRTVFSRRDGIADKKNPRGLDIRNRDAVIGMVILDNGKFGSNGANIVYELQIGNLKQVKIRTAAGAPSLAWVTYNINGDVCRLGPPAQVETGGDIDPRTMAKYEISFLPQEKVLCFAVGKNVRGKMKILYFTK